MPDPAFRSIASNTTGTYNSFPVNKPAGVVDGDLLLVALATYDANGTMAHGSPPAGWTLVRALNSTTDKVRTSVFRKIAASEPASWTFTKTNDASGYGGCICCIAISDPGAPSAPLADEDGQLDPTVDTACTAPSVDAGSSTDLLVYFVAIRLGSGGNAWTAPTGFTERLDIWQSAQDVCLGASTKTAGASGATGAVSATCYTSIRSSTFLLAVAGAAAGGAPFLPRVIAYT